MPAAATYSFGRGFVDPPARTQGQGQGQDQDDGADPLPFPFPRRTFGSDMGDGRGRLLMAGSWNAELYGPLREAASPSADVFVSKNRVSGLWNEEADLLRALGAAPGSPETKTLLFAGVNTNQCVLGTLLDAYYRGFDCVMLEDCCATTTPGGQDVPILDVSVSLRVFA